MAHELKQQLHDCLGCPGPITHRQFLTWQRWLRDRWNEPDRHDHYLMVLACEVRRVLSRQPERIQPKDFLLQFSFQGRKETKKGRQLQTDLAKARWFGLTGYSSKN